jgi:hypothetical protein
MKTFQILTTCALLLTLVYSCNQSSDQTEDATPLTREELKASIKEMEDSLMMISSQKSTGATLSLSQQELINRLTAYYRVYPEDPYSADCLFKVQMAYSGLNAHRKSIAYGDTLLTKFPSYKNKHLAIESNIAALDVFLEPRDTAAIRSYYTMLLADNEYPKSKKAEIRRRLKFINLTIFEYATMSASKKSPTKK